MKLTHIFTIAAAILAVLLFTAFIPVSSSEISPIFYKSENIELKTEAVSSIADTFDFEIDMKDFEDEMEKLKKELKEADLYKYQFDFKEEEFKAQMEKLKEELSDLDFEDFHLEFDNEAFKKNMDELKKELQEQKLSFDFNSDEFKDEIKKLKEEMKELNIDMKDLHIELDLLDEFMTELKIELKSDGYIKDTSEHFELELNKDEMIINGNQVPQSVFNKYKKMYEEHFGSKPDSNHKLIIK